MRQPGKFLYGNRVGEVLLDIGEHRPQVFSSRRHGGMIGAEFRRCGEQESMFYDTIVFHQNMLIGGYDDRSYTEILQPFFSARRRIQAPISPEHSGLLHFLHPSIRFSAASVKTLLSPIFC